MEHIHYSFDALRLGGLKMTVTDDGGTFAVTLDEDEYAHSDFANAVNHRGDTPARLSAILVLAAVLQLQLNGLTSGAGSYTVTYDDAGFYTIAYDNGNITIDLTEATNGDPGLRMAEALGMASDAALSGAASYASTVRPFYLLIPAAMGRTKISPDRYGAGIATDARTDAGVYGQTAVAGAAVETGWLQTIEDETAIDLVTYDGPGTPVHAWRATEAIPWSYQHAWDHALTYLCAIKVIDDVDADPAYAEIHEMRADGLSFAPRYTGADDFAMYSVEYRTRLLARLTGEAAPENTAAPTLAGTVEIGASLAVTPGTWTGSPSLTYTLLRDGTPIAGLDGVSEATIEAYALVSADIGPSLVLRESDSVSSTSADSTAVKYDLGTHWYDVFDVAEATLADGDTTVDSILSTTGTGNEIAAPAASNRPAYSASDAGFNDQPAASGDGSSDYLRDAAYSFGGNPSAWALFDVTRIDGFSAGEAFAQYSQGGVAVRLRMNTGPVAQLTGSGTGIVTSTGTTTLSGAVLIGFDWAEGGNQRVYYGTTVEDTDANGAVVGDSGVMEWAAIGGAFHAQISLALRVVHNALPTATMLTHLAAYCSYRFGV